MRSGLHTFRLPRWGRILSALVVGALLMQGPVQGLLQAAHEALGTHQCAHAQHDMCPRNPDGPCTCAHTDSDTSPEGPIMRACHDGSQAPGAVPVPRWQSPSAPTAVPSPLTSETTRLALSPPPPPERLGDDIFRPPRTTPLYA
ncbi:hypothetical protein [Salinibacter ruber]|uniref:hypothetical protein n=1 Tax=Salinibacter ruber TaxID=146919 RepID=UPI002072D636|nr:hypothetical protein [Salinibacter ruber]MCS4199194.1 hypothetical protein [Salinibacter ruber]